MENTREKTLEKEGLEAATRFLGGFTHKIDSKNRLATPADFRKSLAENAGGDLPALVCCPSFAGPYLECGGEDLIPTLITVVRHLDIFDEKREALEYYIYSSAQRVAFDDNGRICLPADLKTYAELEEQASFIGIGPRFQIWSPARHAEKMALARQAILDDPETFRVRSLPSVVSGMSGKGPTDG